MAWNYWSGERNPEHDRVTNLFRQHVKHRKRGKIVGEIDRQPCQFHPDRDGEFHHVDYRYPFKGAWLCHSCHRKADHGTLSEEDLTVVDYSTVVKLVPHRINKKYKLMPYNEPQREVEDVPF